MLPGTAVARPIDLVRSNACWPFDVVPGHEPEKRDGHWDGAFILLLLQVQSGIQA